MIEIPSQRVTGGDLTMATGTIGIAVLPDGRATIDLGHMRHAVRRDDLLVALGVPVAVIRSQQAVEFMRAEAERKAIVVAERKAATS